MLKKLLPVLVLILLLQACGSAPAEAPATEAAATAAPSTEAALTDVPAATSETIVHKTIPTEGTTARSSAHDNEMSASFENKNVTDADNFLINRLERPFTSNDMNYVPDVDIVDFSITSDDAFFYIRISLSALDSATNTLTGHYGVELDRDRDGRAEIFLEARPPYTAEFNADNVIVYVDLDGDIGGKTASRPDENFTGNGFDAILFDLSQSVHPQDPDLAWVRFVDDKLPSIEIAYKKWLFKGGNESFMWSVWASRSPIDPTIFNLHDSMTEEQAGSANKDSALYPIKALAEIDNTCRVPLGFQASGTEPLGCATAASGDSGGSEGGVGFCGQFASACERSGGGSELPVSDNSRIP